MVNEVLSCSPFLGEVARSKNHEFFFLLCSAKWQMHGRKQHGKERTRGSYSTKDRAVSLSRRNPTLGFAGWLPAPSQHALASGPKNMTHKSDSLSEGAYGMGRKTTSLQLPSSETSGTHYLSPWPAFEYASLEKTSSHFPLRINFSVSLAIFYSISLYFPRRTCSRTLGLSRA